MQLTSLSSRWETCYLFRVLPLLTSQAKSQVHDSQDHQHNLICPQLGLLPPECSPAAPQAPLPVPMSLSGQQKAVSSPEAAFKDMVLCEVRGATKTQENGFSTVSGGATKSILKWRHKLSSSHRSCETPASVGHRVLTSPGAVSGAAGRALRQAGRESEPMQVEGGRRTS